MQKFCCSGERPVIVPQRSTFCFVHNTEYFLKHSEIFTLKQQWDTFERIENYNSIVYSTINGTGTLQTQASDSPTTPLFYTFTSDAELQDYKQGRLNHIAEYPAVADFVVPYANKPLAIRDIIGDPNIFYITPCCQNIDKSKLLTNNERLYNQTGLNLFVRVSTQTAMYPKSPYKFQSAQEYLLYNNYKQTRVLSAP